MGAVNPNHPMSRLMQENAPKIIACVIWKLRKHCPNLEIEITDKDMAELASVFTANGQRGLVAVIGKGDGITLQLLDSKSGRALITPENDENSPNAVLMRKVMDARKRATVVAEALLRYEQADADGVMVKTSRQACDEAAEILKLLTWEPE